MSEYNMTAFTPEDVRAFRKEKGMTQKEFANKIGVSQPKVSLAERNYEDLTVGYLVKMQKAFDVTKPDTKEIGFLKKIWLRLKGEL